MSVYDNLPEHLDYTFNQLVDFLAQIKVSRHMYTKMTYLMDNIKNQTGFLDEVYESVNDRLRINCIRKKYTSSESLICPICKINHIGVSSKFDFNSTCSRPCQDAMNQSLISKSMNCRDIQDVVESNEKRKKTNLTKYGVDNVAKLAETTNKAKHTQIEKYGDIFVKTDQYKNLIKEMWNKKTEEEKSNITRKREKSCMVSMGVVNPSQDESIKNKKKSTLMDNYGVVNPMFCDDIVKKAQTSQKETLNDLYGVDNPIHVPGALEKRKKTFVIKWNESHPMKNVEVVDRMKSTKLVSGGEKSKRLYELKKDPVRLEELYKMYGVEWIADEYGVAFQTIYKMLGIAGIEAIGNTKTSRDEKELADYIEYDLGLDVIRGSRSLLGNGQEIDIYIPSLSIGIEFNGLYWHSSKVVEDSYHLDKYNLAKKNNIRLIHIFEDEWKHSKNIVKSKLKYMLTYSNDTKVYARNTKVVELRNKDVKEFYDMNHIQGHADGSIILGLMYKDAMVSVMSFRETRTEGIELIRFATSMQVVGGFSKLFKHFIRMNIDCNEIVSFADKRWSDGNLYAVNGFNHIYDTPISYSYVINDNRVHKSNYRKDRLGSKLKVYDPDLTERENTFNNRVYRIYDCGLMKFKYTVDSENCL